MSKHASNEERRPPPRYAIFPGSFDPIHNGHIQIAQYACNRYRLDCVYIIPTSRFLNRQSDMTLSSGWRLRLCRAAVADRPLLRLLAHEIIADTPGYLIDTVRTLQEKWSETARMNVLLGSDLLTEIETWKEIDRLATATHLYIFNRAGHNTDSAESHICLGGGATRPLDEHGFSYTICDNPLYAFSSTEVRSRIARGIAVDALLPPAVARLAHRHRLYRET